MGFFSSKEKSETKKSLSADANKYLEPARKKALDYMNNRPDVYGFDTVAGLSPLQQQALQGLAQNQSGNIGDLMYGAGSQGIGLLNQYYGQQQQAPQLTNANIDQFYNSDLVNRQIEGATGVAQNFMDRNLNQIASDSSAVGGARGSRRGAAEGTAVADISAKLGAQTAGIQNDAYTRASNLAQGNINQQYQNNALNANRMGKYMDFTGNALNNASNLYNTGYQQLMAGGDVQRGYDQQLMQDQMMRHNWDDQQSLQGLNTYNNIAKNAWGLVDSETTKTSTPSGASMLAGAAGALTGMGGLAGLGSSLLGTGGAALNPLAGMGSLGGNLSLGGYGSSAPTGGWGAVGGSDYSPIPLSKF